MSLATVLCATPVFAADDNAAPAAPTAATVTPTTPATVRPKPLPRGMRHNPQAGQQLAAVSGGTVAAPAATTTPPATPSATTGLTTPAEPLLPGEKEAIMDCHKYPPNKKFKWDLRGEVDLMMLVNNMAPMMCRPFIVPGSVRQSKATIITPDTMTAAEAYRIFLSALEVMGLTVQPEGKALKIIETSRARESALPVYGGDNDAPPQDQYVIRLLRLNFVPAEEMKAVLERLKSKDGEVGVYAPTNTLLITDLGTNLRKLEEVVRMLDVQMGGQKIFVIKLHSVAAKEMAEMLSQVFGVQKSGGTPPAKSPRLNIANGVRPPVEGEKGSTGSELAVSQIIPVDRLNTLIVVATDKAFQPMLALVKRLDAQKSSGDSPSDRVHVVPLENANSDDVAGTLAGVGAQVSRGGGGSSSSRPGQSPTSTPVSNSTAQQGQSSIFESDVRISSDKPTNSLVVLASGRDYMTVRDLIHKLDLPRRQVFVEGTILEVSIDKSRDIGAGAHAGQQVLGNSLLYGVDAPTANFNTFTLNPTTLSGLAVGLRGSPIANASQILGLPTGVSIPSFGVLLQAVQNNGDVNVVSMPHILTTDNEKAEIKVGQNLPFPGAVTPGAGAGGTAATSGISGLGFFSPPVNRQDVALTLDITPHVNESDYVRMEIEADLQDVDNPNYNGLGPSTSKRNVKSVVTVRDQQSIVIGGLIRDRTSEQVDKVPILGDIPILGYMFKHVNKSIIKQNLLIILTPYVVKDPNDLRKIAERKIRERREFLERFSSFRDDRDYEAEVDYRRKRGLLEEINLSALQAEREVTDVRNSELLMSGQNEDGEIQVPYVPRPRKSRLRSHQDQNAPQEMRNPDGSDGDDDDDDGATRPAPSPRPTDAVPPPKLEPTTGGTRG